MASRLSSIPSSVLLPLFLFLFTTLSAVATEKSSIVIGSAEITNNLTADLSSDGIYDRFLRQLEGIELVFAPYGRLDLLMEGRQIDCLFPGSTETMGHKEELIESLPLHEEPAYLFANQKYASIDEFQYRRIAIRRGLTIGGIREKLDATFIELESDQALVKFMQLGRADAVVSYLHDMQGAYQALQMKLPFYSDKSPVYKSREAFVCLKTKKNIDFINQANQLINEG